MAPVPLLVLRPGTRGRSEAMSVSIWGKIAYEAYCLSSDGRSLVSGQPLPSWDDQDTRIQEAWNAAAQAVREAAAL